MNIGKAIRKSGELNHVSFFKSQGPWTVYPLLSILQSLPKRGIILSPGVSSCKRGDLDGAELLFEVSEFKLL